MKIPDEMLKYLIKKDNFSIFLIELLKYLNDKNNSSSIEDKYKD